jgi:hypothetical protein
VVRVVDPESLESELATASDPIVVCTTVTAPIRTMARGWIELYPGGRDSATSSIAGHQEAHQHLDLEQLLTLLERMSE